MSMPYPQILDYHGGTCRGKNTVTYFVDGAIPWI